MITTTTNRFQAQSDTWWAYSQTRGWVVLDRSFTPNRTTTLTETMQFIRCNDWSAYQQGEDQWDYQAAERYINTLSYEEGVRARRELAALQTNFENQVVRWN